MYDLDRLLESSDRVAVDILYYKLIDGYGKRSPVKGMFFDDGCTNDPNTKACSALEEALDLKAGGASTLKLFANESCDLQLQRAVFGDLANLHRMVIKSPQTFTLTASDPGPADDVLNTIHFWYKADPNSSISHSTTGSAPAAVAGVAPSSMRKRKRGAEEPLPKQHVPEAVRQQMILRLEMYAPRYSDGSFMNQHDVRFKGNKAWYEDILRGLEAWCADNGHGHMTVSDLRGPASNFMKNQRTGVHALLTGKITTNTHTWREVQVAQFKCWDTTYGDAYANPKEHNLESAIAAAEGTQAKTPAAAKTPASLPEAPPPRMNPGAFPTQQLASALQELAAAARAGGSAMHAPAAAAPPARPTPGAGMRSSATANYSGAGCDNGTGQGGGSAGGRHGCLDSSSTDSRMQPSSGQEQGVADDDSGCDAGVPSTIASKLASLRAQAQQHQLQQKQKQSKKQQKQQQQPLQEVQLRSETSIIQGTRWPGAAPAGHSSSSTSTPGASSIIGGVKGVTGSGRQVRAPATYGTPKSAAHYWHDRQGWQQSEQQQAAADENAQAAADGNAGARWAPVPRRNAAGGRRTKVVAAADTAKAAAAVAAAPTQEGEGWEGEATSPAAQATHKAAASQAAVEAAAAAASLISLAQPPEREEFAAAADAIADGDPHSSAPDSSAPQNNRWARVPIAAAGGRAGHKPAVPKGGGGKGAAVLAAAAGKGGSAAAAGVSLSRQRAVRQAGLEGQQLRKLQQQQAAEHDSPKGNKRREQRHSDEEDDENESSYVADEEDDSTELEEECEQQQQGPPFTWMNLR